MNEDWSYIREQFGKNFLNKIVLFLTTIKYWEETFGTFGENFLAGLQELNFTCPGDFLEFSLENYAFEAAWIATWRSKQSIY